MVCPHCFHTIGEHYLCRLHGGKDGFSAGAAKWKPKPLDLPPMPENFRDAWWDFIDSGQKVLAEAIP